MMPIFCFYRFLILAILAAPFFLSGPYAIASTKVGNGGDVIDRYLANTRNTLGMVLTDSISNSKTKKLCAQIERLTDEEKEFCSEKLSEVFIDLRNTVMRVPPTPLRLSPKRLTVLTSGGIERPVLALTECGTGGDITFDYFAIKDMAPSQMFFLMAHEFLHKVPFEGQPCLQDSDTPGPFKEVEGGRRLIDAMAESLMRSGIDSGRIGKNFRIVDTFFCDISESKSGMKFPSHASANRIFLTGGDLGTYVAGVGIVPGNSECSLIENFGRSKVTFRFRVNESNNCADPTASDKRNTEWELVREFVRNETGQPSEPEILARASFPGVNPLCGWDPFPVDFSSEFTTETGYVWKFNIRYANSTANQE
jgi:hypothetical protein